MLGTVLKQVFRRRDPVIEAPIRFYNHNVLVGQAERKAQFLQRSGFLDYPAIVHLETITLCNAACNFCPYPTTGRKGNRMSDAMISKIIGDLSDIPRDLGFQIAPYKLSDPFLEVRLFDVMDQISARLPNARISLISNGSALTPDKMQMLKRFSNIAYLNISLNYCDAAEYESVMHLPFDRTLRRLRQLHELNAESAFGFPIRLTRVASDGISDHQWLDWCREELPSFEPVIIPRNDWIGEAVTPESSSQVPNVPCHRWFDLSIISTGDVAMCCMDGDARYPKGSVETQHALDIYNQPHLRRLRETLVGRALAGDPCSRCTYLSY